MILGPDAVGRDDEPDPRDIERTRALYRGYVTFCDERFGRFLDTLERAGSLDESVVVVLSDHGTELWDKGQFGKSGPRLHPYNTQINLMIRHPDYRGRGLSCDAFVQNQDLAPTILRLLEIPAPPLDGADVWAVATDNAPPPRDHVVIGWDRWASIRDRGWNLIVDTLEPTADLRLFDVRRDPDESHNLASARPDVVRQQLDRLEATLGMPLPARYQHRPLRGDAATVGGLRQARDDVARAGERWVGSNQV